LPPVTVLGVIPARGGSKAVPRKNLQPLGGVPLIVHTIRAAAAASSLDRFLVTTDDDEIAAVAESHGAEVVRRPAELATDESSTEVALIHAVESAGEPQPEWVVTLEPTSPLRSPRLIDECVAKAIGLGADAVMTVVETRSIYGRLDGGAFTPLSPGQARRRQDREPLYRESSTVYVTRTAHLLRTSSVLADPTYAVVVPEEEAVDVNTALDLAVAEALLLQRPGVQA
jgi:CMP-N-acetylneuraminic acid synthetase